MSFISSLGEWLRKVSKSFMSATISGKTITLTRHNGDTVTLTTQDTTYEQASQSTSGLMSAEDKAILDAIPSTYAVKYGSLTDNPIIRTSQSGREANIINIGSDLTNPDTSETFDLGWNYVNRDGALLGLRSSSYSTEPGYFKLYARDENRQSILQGTPNGELTWRGNQVITIIDTATTTKNGLMSAEDKTAVDSIPSLGTYNRMFFSQTSGTYTAPRTGWYCITLKGGGGGGGGAQTDRYATGGGGGEGGTIIFYATLTKGQSYAYTIGAGGAAGANGADNLSAINGDTGGTSTFVVGDVTYSVTGGEGGTRRYSSGRGGLGGRVKTPNNNNIYLIPGARGGNGVATDSGTSYIDSSPVGGGAGVSVQPYQSIYGGGGNGGGPLAVNMTNVLEPTAGGNGYILIEYAR